jgi:hypothetical protein
MTEEKNQSQVLQNVSMDALFDDAPLTVEPTSKVEEVKLPLDNLFEEIKLDDDKTPEVKKEPKEVKTNEAPQVNIYTDKVKEWIEEGFWEDVDIEIENEAGEKELVPITDIKDLTPELFAQIKEQQNELKKQDLDSKYVSVEGLDDRTKKMIELKKAGGDLSELIQQEVQYVNPLNGLDLEDERIQEHLIRQKYTSLGWKPKHIEAEIEELKEAMTLDLEAKKVIGEINSNTQKEFKKTMVEAFRSLDLKNDNLVKSLVDVTAKYDEYGLTDVDKSFFQAKSNPELFAKVAFLLTDEKAFSEFSGVKIKNKANTEVLRKVLSITPKTTNQASVKQEKKLTGGMDDLFDK